jgi:hypothetical protein
MNYLTTWYETMRLFKWTQVLGDHPYLKKLDALKAELEGFFPLSDFDTPQKLNSHNWILFLCADNQPNSIYILNEIAELIRYYNYLGKPESYHIKNKEGSIDYSHLQEWLFEIQVHYLLSEIGLSPEIGQTYLSEQSIVKPMDILLTVGEQCYNVETTKYYDHFKEELLAFGTRIIAHIQTTAIKRKLTLDEIFSGYFAFNERNEQVLRKNKSIFTQGVKSFIHAYRSVKETTIFLPAKKVTDEFEFHIEPAFANNYENGYEMHLDSFAGYIKFQLRADLYLNRTIANVKASVKESIPERNKRLLAKIKDKIKQHKTCPHSLLIVIAIEQVFTSHEKNRASAIDSSDVDAEAIHKLIHGKAIILLLFKTLKIDGITYHKMILGDLSEHQSLITALQDIDPVIYYEKRDFKS